jgi:maltose O-acetyltransferase
MLAGELYVPSDPELLAARLRCRRLLRELNGSAPDDQVGRARALGELLGALGEGAVIEPPLYCDYGANIFIGARFYANFGCVILDCARVDIGDDVFFAPNVQLYPATHPLDAATRISGVELARPIRVGSRVWIGGGAILLPGVSIGEGTVIGAGAVVTRDVPAGVLAVGNPCRAVRSL